MWLKLLLFVDCWFWGWLAGLLWCRLWLIVLRLADVWVCLYCVFFRGVLCALWIVLCGADCLYLICYFVILPVVLWWGFGVFWLVGLLYCLLQICLIWVWIPLDFAVVNSWIFVVCGSLLCGLGLVGLLFCACRCIAGYCLLLFGLLLRFCCVLLYGLFWVFNFVCWNYLTLDLMFVF